MKQKNILSISAICFVLYPFMVGFEGGDPFQRTIIDMVFGSGTYQYTSNDCGTRHTENHSYSDIGGVVRYQKGSLVLIGRAGHVHADNSSSDSYDSSGITYQSSNSSSVTNAWWIGAGIGFSTSYFGLDAGANYIDNIRGLDGYWITSNVTPFADMRIGKDTSWHFTMSYLSNPTYLSNGGAIEFGWYFPVARSSFWIGMGMGPYKTTNLTGRMTITPARLPVGFLFSGSLNIGSSGSDYNGSSSSMDAASFTFGVRCAF